MKRSVLIKRAVWFFTMLLLLSCCGRTIVWAVPDREEIEIPEDYKTAELMELDSRQNVVVSVKYDKEIPDIYFITPKGDVLYPELVSEELLYVEYGETTVYYYLPNAEKGTWEIAYDKKGNDTLEVNFGNFSEGIWINDFSVLEFDEEVLKTAFSADYKEDARFDYTVYAVTTDEDGTVQGQRELYSGSARANEDVELEITLKNLASYENYRLMLEISIEENGIMLTDSFVTEDTYSYTNPNEPEAMEDFHAELNLSTGSLTVDWSEYDVWCDEYILAVFSSENMEEPVYANTFERSITRTELLVDMEAPELIVEVRYRNNGNTSQAAVKTIPCKNITDKIVIETAEYTNAAQAVISYDVPSKTDAWIVVNEETEQTEFDAQGYISVDIGEFDNQIQVLYTRGDNLVYVVEKEIYADRTAPILRFYEKMSHIKTEAETFTLVGETESGASISVNGAQAEVGEDGTFSILLSLETGDNSFEIVAADRANNTSRQILNITRITADAQQTGAVAGPQENKEQKSFLMTYLPLIITVICTLIAALTVILSYEACRKKVTKGLATLVTLRNLCGILTLLSGAGAVWLFIQKQRSSQKVYSKEFFKLAQELLSEAYQAIMDYRTYSDWFMILLAAAGVCLLLWILFALAVRLLKGRKHKVLAEQKAEEKTSVPDVKDEGTETLSKAKADEEKESGLKTEETIVPDVKTEEEKAAAPETEKEAVPDRKIFCRHCGKQLRLGAKFCTQCGKPLE